MGMSCISEMPRIYPATTQSQEAIKSPVIPTGFGSSEGEVEAHSDVKLESHLKFQCDSSIHGTGSSLSCFTSNGVNSNASKKNQHKLSCLLKRIGSLSHTREGPSSCDVQGFNLPPSLC